MTTPNIVPAEFAGDSTDFLKVKRDTFGAVRTVTGNVSVTSGTAANDYVGLVPFQKGAVFKIDDKSVHCGNFGAGTTTVNLGVIYDDDTSFTNDPDAWAAADTAPQSGGFVNVTDGATAPAGLTLETEGNGWLVVQLLTAAADATADITFSVDVKYD